MIVSESLREILYEFLEAKEPLFVSDLSCYEEAETEAERLRIRRKVNKLKNLGLIERSTDEYFHRLGYAYIPTEKAIKELVGYRSEKQEEEEFYIVSG